MTRPFSGIMFTVLLLLLPAGGPAQSLLQGPNDIVFDESHNRYLVSNWAGNTIVAIDARGNQSLFRDGIPHAHGMELRDTLLFVASNQRLLTIHTGTGEILDSITVPDAQTLGHLALDYPSVYASDWTARRIFRIDLSTDTASTLLTISDMPMGIWHEPENNRLILLTFVGSAPIRAVSLPSGALSTIRTTTINSTDAIARDAAGRYYVTSLPGNTVTMFNPDWSGAPTLVSAGLSGPSGLGYNARDNILGVTNYDAGSTTLLALDDLLGSTRVRFAHALLDDPEDIVYDASRACCYIATVAGDRIVRMDTAGTFSTLLDSINSPMALALLGDTLLITSNQPSTITGLDLATEEVLFRIPVPEAQYLAQIDTDPRTGEAYIVEQRGMVVKVRASGPSYVVFVPRGAGLVYGSQSAEVDTANGCLYVFQWPAGTIRRVALSDSTQITDVAPQVISQVTASTGEPSGDIHVSSWLGNSVYRYLPGVAAAPVVVSAGHVQPAGLDYVSASRTLYVCNYGGNTIDRVVFPSAPATPVLVAPPDGAPDEPAMPLFRWNRSSGALTYHLQVAADSLFPPGMVVDDAGITDTSFTGVLLAPLMTYYWRVLARNDAGESAWSLRRRFTTTGEMTHTYVLRAGWNLIAVSHRVADARATELFPGAVSCAYGYDPAAGYRRCDTLRIGEAYWLKFPDSRTVAVTGRPCPAETVEVRRGWNLIGPPSQPVPAGSVIQIPPGIVESAYSAYDSTYVPADSLHPGKGYWVKVRGDGVLLLR